MLNEDEDEDEDDGPASTTEVLRGDDVPTEASETVHQSIYRYYRFLLRFFTIKKKCFIRLFRIQNIRWFRIAQRCSGVEPPQRTVDL
jgi:hypothetical protein